MPSKKKLIFIKLLITSILFTFLAQRISWRTLADHISNIEWSVYFLGFIVLGLAYLVTAIRWLVILTTQNLQLPLSTILSIDLIALFFNSFLPGSTGGDAMRAYYAAQLLPGEWTRIISSIIFDRAIGLFALLSLGYIAIWLSPTIGLHLDTLDAFLRFLPPILVIFVVSIVGLFVLPGRALPGIAKKGIESLTKRPVVGQIVVFIKDARKAPGSLLASLGFSIAGQMLSFLSAFLIARSLNLNISFFEIALIIAIVQTAVSIPVSFAGHGVREIVLVAMFSALGIGSGEAEIAIAFSIGLFSAQLLWSLLGGGWFVFRPHQFRNFALGNTTEK